MQTESEEPKTDQPENPPKPMAKDKPKPVKSWRPPINSKEEQARLRFLSDSRVIERQWLHITGW